MRCFEIMTFELAYKSYYYASTYNELCSTQHDGANWTKAIHKKEASVYVFSEGGGLGILLFLALCHNYLIDTRLEVCFVHWLFIERC